ncbi:MAG: hypothetical protein KIG65_00120 [Eubacteriales bacterium]|nr:hypothetical protein [Eubacteriales bacterium]
MFKKISIIILSILLTTTLTSCGKYGKLYETLDSIVIQTVFPEAISGATTFDEARESVYMQQKALCESMIESYNLTDVETLREQHAQINRNKMMSELSSKRQALNNASTELFIENLKVILENVDEKQLELNMYIDNCVDEVLEFYSDYDKLVNSDLDDFETISKVFVSYAFSKNNFAKSVIVEYTDKITEAATKTIEQNANAQASFRTNIAKNNEIIKAINEVLGGVNSNANYKKRINDANRKLLEKTLNSMSSMSQKERDAILSQFEEA